MNLYFTANEIQNAEYFWIKYVQAEFYSTEISDLRNNKQLQNNSEIKSLVTFFKEFSEDGLLRITGRLLEAAVCFGEKHPVILPRRCKFTELLVTREHERIGHCGVSATLTQLRKNIGYLKAVNNGIHWKFIVERAPWWGGFYERLVKTVKEPLRKILGKALLTFEELSTILSEVEVIVNNRPLTYVENDPGEPEPLTPVGSLPRIGLLTLNTLYILSYSLTL
ncbi:hypothetical protein AVEN_214187-1 [Araneus ventricosus]|uniref:Integrase zinc-binding domain-containing protein n=1 Tax=Araneus ventricosus TaxID=182803 RepID=A0A4Y2FVT0_ARAVE|nr:hypothetical protein AVEN_214187-1 [Araneus ventricosus]